MTSTFKTMLAASTIALAPAATFAADSIAQNFVFVADFAADNAAADAAMAPALVRKVVAHAKANGFNYGDTIMLRTAPGGDPAWNQDIKVLKSAGNHPQQLDGFLTSRLSALGQAALPARSQVIWTLQSLSHFDCDAVPTTIYVFANGLSAADVVGDDVNASGTIPGALQNCALVWVGLGLKDTQSLSLNAKIRLDHLFGQISKGAGASHAVVR